MCTQDCLDFVKDALDIGDVIGKRILEVGAYNVNGSARTWIEALKPDLYLGVDIRPGLGVDSLCDAVELVNRFGAETFDGIVSTETLEHILDWRTAIQQMKTVLAPGGWLLITTRSPSFPYHEFPADFWRFTPSTMVDALEDFHVELLRPDPGNPGVFVFARKPMEWEAKDIGAVDAAPVEKPHDTEK